MLQPMPHACAAKATHAITIASQMNIHLDGLLMHRVASCVKGIANCRGTALVAAAAAHVHMRPENRFRSAKSSKWRNVEQDLNVMKEG